MKGYLQQNKSKVKPAEAIDIKLKMDMLTDAEKQYFAGMVDGIIASRILKH